MFTEFFVVLNPYPVQHYIGQQTVINVTLAHYNIHIPRTWSLMYNDSATTSLMLYTSSRQILRRELGQSLEFSTAPERS